MAAITLLRIPFQFGANNPGEICGFTDPQIIASLIGAGALVIQDGRDKPAPPAAQPKNEPVILEFDEAPKEAAPPAALPKSWLAGAPKPPKK